ncbi:MAG: transporter ATP-binding protein [Flavipsychrobacter sp.]|nr:transporter ATP-binding protein [Flavipsychrobacter sp.]
MADANTILSVTGLQISFTGKDTFTAVNNISFNIGKGKTLAIVGESGSGKSLTALALMGLQPTTASVNGDMLLTAGNTTSPLTPYNLQQLRGKEIGMVFQEPMSSLNPVMTIGKQLRESILIHQNISKEAGKQLAIDWLGKVQLPEPAKMYDRYPHQLSGGQKQRVMIAMAMCNHPALLIADEPTTALDVTVQQEIIRLMHYLQQEHQSAMIFITHDFALAATIADDVLVMYKGEMMEYGPAAEVLRSPQHAYTQALLACRPAADKKGYRLPIVADFLNTEQIVQTKVPIAPTPVSSGTLLEVKDLRIWFPEDKNLLGKPLSYFKAVDDVSFTLRKGEVLGLVGESGCGKSTLSRSLVGLLPVHSGSIDFEGEDLTQVPIREWARVRRKIQMIFQDPYSSLNPRMTIGDMLMEPLMVHNMVPKQGLQKEALRLLDLVQLPADTFHRYPHQFSGGQRQRIGIARALSLKPELLICDESVSALDVSIQAQILNLLKDLQQQFGLTYLFISHDLSVVHYISDRVMVMHDGKIVESGDAEQVLKHPQDAYTQKLVAATH